MKKEDVKEETHSHPMDVYIREGNGTLGVL